MVKVAIAGGSGNVAAGIIKVLAATKKHEIVVLSRKETTTTSISTQNGSGAIKVVKTDYFDKEGLVAILQGVDVVLSFVGGPQDPGSKIQKNLIEASVVAGVRRFAPSEWSSSSTEELPWYKEKEVIRTYLADLNKSKKVIEYTLFQPGLLLDYFAPRESTSLSSTQELFIDFPNRRAIIIDGENSSGGGEDGVLTLTTVNDLANVVLRAIEYEGEWPVIGGVHGTTLSIKEILEIGGKVRGKSFNVTTLEESDVRNDTFATPWIPRFSMPGASEQEINELSRVILKGSLLSALKRSWVVGDQWNSLVPDYRFEGAEEYLERCWMGKE